MSAPRNFFDVVVIGSEPGGLVAAALLSKKGYRVAVVPGEQEASTPFLVPGGRSAAVLGWVFTQLGLTQEMRNRLRRLDPTCQVILPRHRLDLASQATETRNELQREFPDDPAMIADWLDNLEAGRALTDRLLDPPPLLPAEGMRDLRQWRSRLRAAEVEAGAFEEIDLLRQVPNGHALRSVVGSCVRFLSQVEPVRQTGPGPLRLFSLLTDGLWVIEGGRAGFLETMTQRLRTYGATILNMGQARALEPSWRSDVVVVTDKEPIGARVVIYAADARQLPSLLPEGSKRRKLEVLVESARAPQK